MSVCTDAGRSLHRFSVAESQIMLLHKERIKDIHPPQTLICCSLNECHPAIFLRVFPELEQCDNLQEEQDNHRDYPNDETDKLHFFIRTIQKFVT